MGGVEGTNAAAFPFWQEPEALPPAAARGRGKHGSQNLAAGNAASVPEAQPHRPQWWSPSFLKSSPLYASFRKRSLNHSRALNRKITSRSACKHRQDTGALKDRWFWVQKQMPGHCLQSPRSGYAGGCTPRWCERSVHAVACRLCEARPGSGALLNCSMVLTSQRPAPHPSLPPPPRRLKHVHPSLT